MARWTLPPRGRTVTSPGIATRNTPPRDAGLGEGAVTPGRQPASTTEAMSSAAIRRMGA